VIKLIVQSYPGGKALLLQFGGRDLYNFRKNTLVAIWQLMKKRIGRYAILLNGACLSLKINTCHIAAAGIASQPIY
jgi:hypothetical protein